jgi:membrane protease YdiL (CAAX protease family)
MATKTTRAAAKTTGRQSATTKAAAKKIVEDVAVAKETPIKKRRSFRIWSAHLVKAFAPLRKGRGLAAGVVFLILAVQLALLWKPIVGIYVNAAAFAVLCGIALVRESYRKLAISVAILPVATMITLSLPQSSHFAESVVFYDALLLLALVYRFWFTIDEPLSNTALTLRGYGLTLPLMVVVGQLLGGASYLTLRNYYAYQPTSLPLVVVASIVFAIAEEMLFRGLIQQRAAKIMHPALAAVVSAILYASVNIDHSTIWAPAMGLLIGAVLSFIYFKKQNLLLTITVNAMSKLAFLGLLATFVLR